jgi:hypothetical protein
MANSQNEEFTRTVGVLNSCGINLIIPALVSQLGKISSDDPSRNKNFDGEYDELLGKFNDHYGSNLDTKQLHDFLASKSYFEQQFILDAVLRQYMVENCRKEAQEAGARFEDNVTQLTSWDDYNALAGVEILDSNSEDKKEKENSVFPGKYPMMPYDQAIKNLFQPLGHNLKMNDFDQATSQYHERQHPFDDLSNPISTVEVYDKNDHYELAIDAQDDKNMQQSPYYDIKDRLSNAINASGAKLDDSEKMDKQNFDLVTNHVNEILSDSKELTQFELAKFLSLESDKPSLGASTDPTDSIAGYTSKQVEELKDTFKGAFIAVKDLLRYMNSNFDQNGKTVTENDYKQLETQYHGDELKSKIAELDRKMAMQLQAEEIDMFKNPLKNSIQTHTSEHGLNSPKAEEQKDDTNSPGP